MWQIKSYHVQELNADSVMSVLATFQADEGLVTIHKIRSIAQMSGSRIEIVWEPEDDDTIVRGED